MNQETAVEKTETRVMQTISTAQVEQAFRSYKEIQKMLDGLMPDQLMKIGKKIFRKKGYWRAIKRWAQLEAQIVNEERVEQDAVLGPGLTYHDWGYRVRVRITAPNGMYEEGDGACMASEKIVYEKDWKAGKKNGRYQLKKDKNGAPVIDFFETSKNATMHNVRSHAVTRAKNRAISDLVGFGEVSAEELPHGAGNSDHNDDDPGNSGKRPAQRRANTQDAASTWDTQLWNNAKENGMSNEEWSAMIKQVGIKGYDKATDEQKKKMNEFVAHWIADMETLAAPETHEKHDMSSISQEQDENHRF